MRSDGRRKCAGAGKRERWGMTAREDSRRDRVLERETRVWDILGVAIMLSMAGLAYWWLLPR